MPPTLVTENEFISSRYGEIEIAGRLSDLLMNAESAIESRLHRTIIPRQHIEQFRPISNVLFVVRRPIRSLDLVRRRHTHLNGWETVPSTYFLINSDAGYIESLAGEVHGYEVEITYTAGLATVPGAVKEAVILQTVMLSYQDIEAFGAGDGKEPGLKYMNDEIERLIGPYRQTATVYH